MSELKNPLRKAKMLCGKNYMQSLVGNFDFHLWEIKIYL